MSLIQILLFFIENKNKISSILYANHETDNSLDDLNHKQSYKYKTKQPTYILHQIKIYKLNNNPQLTMLS